MDAVDVVIAGKVDEEAMQVDLDLGHARIQVGAGLAVGGAVPPIAAVTRVHAARLTREKGVHPGVHLDPWHRCVREPDDIGQWVEVARAGDVFRARLVGAVEVRVACFADLHDQRVQVGSPRIGHELFDLGRRLDSIVEGIDPDRAVLGRPQHQRSR